jgi:putative hydrolase of the HAD superfamily
MKPDQRIFQLACTKLNLLPEECLFVGDGGSNELTAAKAFGMQSVLIRVPYDDVPAGSEVGEGEFWTGPRISSIPEVLGLLE